MLRSGYILLVRLHPAAFRQRFGEEMVEIFDCSAGIGAALHLMLDAALSAMRQRLFRSEFNRPALATNASLFRTIELYRTSPLVFIEGGLLSLALLFIGGFMAERGGGSFLIGAHQPTRHLLPVDRASIGEARPYTVIQLGPEREDSWKKIASEYFQIIRVLDVLDADRDLRLSPWEIFTAPAALRKLDLDQDGALSAEECGFYVGPNGHFLPKFMAEARLQFMRANPVLAALDSDHDGVISAAEILNSAAALRTLDRNGDGSLSPNELLPDSLIHGALSK